MDSSSFPNSVVRWVALRTSARWEKKIASALTTADIPVFVPLLTRVTKYASKLQTTQAPMFAGYVFCSEDHFAGNSRILAETRRQIAQILRPPDYQVLKAELASIANVVACHRLIQERVFGQIGDRVYITAGSLAGTEGVILQLKPNQRRLVLEVSFLGARLEVVIDDALVARSGA